MTTLAEHMIVDGAENHPPMLKKSIPKKYSKLTEEQQLQDDYDVQATNIILHGLPPDVYSLVNHQEAAKYPDPLALVANSQTLYNPSQYPQHLVPSMHPSPQQVTPVYATPIHHQHHYTPQGGDPIDYINKAMAFLSVVASRFPPSNNQLRTSSNPRNQATIQDGRVTVQQVQGRQTQSFAGTRNSGIATTSRGNYAASQARVVKCYNCQGEEHMAKPCTQPKMPRHSALFKEKLLLVEAQEAIQILNEEQLAFIAAKAQVAQQTIPQNSSFQTKDLDAYDSDCDDVSSAKAVLMENLSRCDSKVLFEVSYSDTYLNDMINQDVQEMSYSEQTYIVDFPDNEITSDSNIIPYSKYLQES
ncbi:retrovirus-related pol polyprotein from transposon TNT 1-94 [Tanacetum coccineum]